MTACTYRRNLLWQVDILGELHLALLQWALEVRLANGVASIRLLVDECNQAVFDLEVHLEALANLLLEVACCLDAELLATIMCVSKAYRSCGMAKPSFKQLGDPTYAYQELHTASVGWGSD